MLQQDAYPQMSYGTWGEGPLDGSGDMKATLPAGFATALHSWGIQQAVAMLGCGLAAAGAPRDPVPGSVPRAVLGFKARP